MIIAIPTLCRYAAVHEQVGTIAAGTVGPDFVLVIDNGQRCAPGADEWRGARGPKRPAMHVEYVVPPFNVGVAAAWNYALRRAAERHTWLVVMNDDIILARDSIERLVAGLEAAPDDVLVVGGHPLEPWSFFVVEARRFRERVGEFDQQFWPAYYEDNDMDGRLARVGARMIRVETGATHLGAATKAALDPAARAQLDRSYRNSRRLYQAKWGGQPPRGELYEAPYDPRKLRGVP